MEANQWTINYYETSFCKRTMLITTTLKKKQLVYRDDNEYGELKAPLSSTRLKWEDKLDTYVLNESDIFQDDEVGKTIQIQEIR